MRILLPLALATGAIGQIPADTVLTFESTSLLDPYYKLIDVFGRGTTTLREQNVFMAINSVAVDPSSPLQFYYLGTAQSFAGTWRADVDVFAEIGTNIWGSWSQLPAERIEIGSGFIVTLDAFGGVEAYPKAGNQLPQTLTVPQGIDIALFGDLLYTATFDPGGPSPLFENDLATPASRTVGSYVGVTSVAVSTTGTELCIGTQSGDVTRIDVATGQVLATIATGLGPITAVGYTRFGTVVYTDGASLFSELVTTGPIYTSATEIVDFGVATATGPSLIPYGVGCGVGTAAGWATTGLPTLGNNLFGLGITGAPAQTFALLALGASRTQWTGTGLALPFDLAPFGAAGCQLLVDPQTVVLQTTTPSGTATQFVPIPSTPSLAGVEFVAQWFVPDPGVGSFGIAVTEAVAFVVD